MKTPCASAYTPRTKMGAVSDKALALVPPARAYMVTTAKVSCLLEKKGLSA